MGIGPPRGIAGDHVAERDNPVDVWSSGDQETVSVVGQLGGRIVTSTSADSKSSLGSSQLSWNFGPTFCTCVPGDIQSVSSTGVSLMVEQITTSASATASFAEVVGVK